MLRFVANLGMFFTDSPLLGRIRLAAEAGFRVVEIWMPDEVEPSQIARAATAAGVGILQFNLALGDYFGGERGLLALPGREAAFRESITDALRYADLLGARQVNCLAGNRLPDMDLQAQLDCLAANLTWATPILERHDLRLNIEPLSEPANPHYLFHRPHDLFALLDGLDLSHVGVQYDLYHAQLAEGNLVATLRQHIGRIGHIQAADAPDRHQPGTGEINFRYVFGQIEALGYAGHIGLEYAPTGSTVDSLRWLPAGLSAEARTDDLGL